MAAPGGEQGLESHHPPKETEFPAAIGRLVRCPCVELHISIILEIWKSKHAE